MYIFGNPFVTTQIEKKLWRLEKRLWFMFRGILVESPECLLFDGSSIPNIASPLIGHQMEGANGISGAFHDPGYALREQTQEFNDAMYLEIHRLLGTNYFSRHAKHRFLRSVGWIAYNQHDGTISIDPERNLKGYGYVEEDFKMA